jgi:hypothetical protein
MSTQTVPVTITPEAAAWIDARRLRRPLDQILEYGRENVSGLRAVRVILETAVDEGNLEYAAVEAELPGPDNGEGFAWWSWRLDDFPRCVCEQLRLYCEVGEADARPEVS